MGKGNAGQGPGARTRRANSKQGGHTQRTVVLEQKIWFEITDLACSLSICRGGVGLGETVQGRHDRGLAPPISPPRL